METAKLSVALMLKSLVSKKNFCIDAKTCSYLILRCWIQIWP